MSNFSLYKTIIQTKKQEPPVNIGNNVPLYICKDGEIFYNKLTSNLYVCVDNTCKFPVTSVLEALSLMED